MSDGTSIEWTDATWNPVTGCSIVSPGCTNCYAMRLAGTRLRHHPSRAGLTIDTKASQSGERTKKSHPVWNGQVRFNEGWLTEPLKWKRPRRIFVCAHGDLFAEGVRDEWIDQVFAVMALAPQHQFQVLTKRPERMRAYIRLADCRSPGFRESAIGIDVRYAYRSDDRCHWPLPNVWLGVSVEDQKRADERIPVLLDTPAAVRFLSVEPLLGPVDLGAAVGWRGQDGFDPLATKIDWVIVGGESGPGSRPMHPTWARSLRDQCKAAGVPFFFKQWGAWAPDGAPLTHEAIDVLPDGAVRQWDDAEGRLVHPDMRPMYHVGKKYAGRMLDGVEHNGMPEVGTGVP